MIEGLVQMIFHGILIGVVVSAPMGPVGIFCIQRSLDRGRMSGFFTGVGAAVSDLIYCLLTGFCLSFIEDFINMHRAPIQLLGASVLIVFGIWLIKKKPDRKVECAEDADTPSPKSDILKGFALTFSNPLILFLIIGLFAQFNFVIEGMKFYHYILGFIGIFAGALGWWWTVTYFVDKIRGHFTQKTMKLINTIVGIIILIFAAVGLFSSVKSFASAPPAPKAILKKGGLAAASFRIADMSMKGWTATLADPDGRGFMMKVMPLSRIDAFGDTDSRYLKVDIIDIELDSLLAEGEIARGADCYSGMNSWKIALSNDRWHVYAGNREFNHILDFKNAYVNLSSPIVKSLDNGNISLSCMSSDFGIATCGLPNREDLFSLLDTSKWNKDAPEGVFKLYDYQRDDAYADIGGKYCAALLPQSDGEFDFVYMSGASVLAELWEPGMIKAKFYPTSFKNVFDVCWVDARQSLMQHDVHADFDPLSGILTVRFPYQNAILRFRK